MSDSALSVLVISPESIIYEGQTTAITSLNEKGEFDILPLHTNFISIIKKKLTLHKLTGEKMEINIDNGIVKVLENKVYIFLGIEMQ